MSWRRTTGNAIGDKGPTSPTQRTIGNSQMPGVETQF